MVTHVLEVLAAHKRTFPEENVARLLIAVAEQITHKGTGTLPG